MTPLAVTILLVGFAVAFVTYCLALMGFVLWQMFKMMRDE